MCSQPVGANIFVNKWGNADNIFQEIFSTIWCMTFSKWLLIKNLKSSFCFNARERLFFLKPFYIKSAEKFYQFITFCLKVFQPAEGKPSSFSFFYLDPLIMFLASFQVLCFEFAILILVSKSVPKSFQTDAWIFVLWISIWFSWIACSCPWISGASHSEPLQKEIYC